MFQGKIFLIDAGPNILHSLNALGIGINEIVGIFHTHAHDDHFAGMTTLMRSGHKIKYFATPLVRTSVIKKLSVLASMEEEAFYNYFEVYNLMPETWNEIDGLEVKPIISPHPLETTIFIFRTVCAEGHRSYAHFADIITLNTLETFIAENETEPGITQKFYEDTKTKYSTIADLKKIDIGGGIIHGCAMDFKDDPSGKIVLAHTSKEFSQQEKEVGSGAPFGAVDILLPARQDYLWKYGSTYLQSNFSSVPQHQINMLLNNPIKTFNPESILLKKGDMVENIYLILTGDIEMVHTESDVYNILSSGGFVGEFAGLTRTAAKETYRAVTFVKALQIPSRLYLEFVKRNGLYDEIMSLQEKQAFLQSTWLLGESISYPTQIELCKAISIETVHGADIIPVENQNRISIVQQGKLEIYLNQDIIDILTTGDFYGESGVLYGTPSLFKLKSVQPTEIYHIAGGSLLNIPIVYWKLFETYQKRMQTILNPELISIPIFQWRDEYSSNVQEIDRDHRALFQNADRLYASIQSGEGRASLTEILGFLIQYTAEHFDREERLMGKYDYPDKLKHREKHQLLIGQVLGIDKQYRDREIEIDSEFISFLKDWVINHILTEDRKLGPFLNGKGVF